jgi:hypothetical protein
MASTAKGFSPQLSAANLLIGEVPLDSLVPLINKSSTPEGKIQNLTASVTDMILNRTCDGASSLTIQMQDPFRSILRSGIFDFGLVVTWDGLDFALVQFAKQGDQLQIVVEAALAYNLRLQKGALTWSSTTNLQGFVAFLLSTVPGATLVAQPGPGRFDTGSGATASTTTSTSVPIARGTTSTPNEDSWTCINRLADAAGWRVFESEGVLYLGSDDWLLGQFPSAGTLEEFTPSVMNIDGTYDLGLPLGQASVQTILEDVTFHPGQRVTLKGMGPLSAQDWMIYSMQRDLFSPLGSLTLQVPMSSEQVRLGAPTLQYV